MKLSRKVVSSSSTLSILSQYSPRIQIMEALWGVGGGGGGGRQKERQSSLVHQPREGEWVSVLDPDLASGSSRESRFSQRVEMMLSYWLGYLRKMSYTHTHTHTHSNDRTSYKKPGGKNPYMYMYCM